MTMDVEEMQTNEITESFDSNTFPDLLPIYYKRLFPFSLFHEWLKYNNDRFITHREFSFTLKDDVYIRYQSFKDEEELKKEVIQKCPYKIDIGAIYSHRPSDQRTATNFHPLEKELVFDIDMTDYDEVRTCCNGADICQKCWPFMTVAVKILDRALREDFGFKHLLWVYSGRRGIHCWVCDQEARQLSPAARTAVAEYLSLIKGGEYKAKKVYLPDIIHPCLILASNIINNYFDDLMLDKQDILSNTDNCDKVLAMCIDQNAKSMLKKAFADCSTSKQRWEKLEQIDDIVMPQKLGKIRTKNFVTEVKFQLCYPRLDINVTKGLNHLLKAPFCVHPKTGRVCVPMDVEEIDKFDPFTVPTVASLCKQIDDHDATYKETSKTDSPEEESKPDLKNIEDYTKTSLFQSIMVFKKFVENLKEAYK